MSKSCFCVLMIPLLLLTGCQEWQGKQTFAGFREKLLASQGVQTELSLHCDMGQSVGEYELCVSSDDEGYTVAVLEPELIAGVEVRFDALGAEISCDGVRLSVGTVAGLTPVTAVPAMLKSMRWGYEELLWREEDMTAARLWLDDGAVMTLWLSEDAVPLWAEIRDETGAAVMTCTFHTWIYN